VATSAAEDATQQPTEPPLSVELNLEESIAANISNTEAAGVPFVAGFQNFATDTFAKDCSKLLKSK
jgi:hypothetical protein